MSDCDCDCNDEMENLRDEIAALRAHAARLEGEVERLRKRDGIIYVEDGSMLRPMLDAAESRAARLEERLVVARGVLKSVEWGGYDEFRGSVCPVCYRPDNRVGHEEGCALAAALGEG